MIYIEFDAIPCYYSKQKKIIFPTIIQRTTWFFQGALQDEK